LLGRRGRAVVVLAVALCPVRNDGVSVRASDTVWKELFELVAVFLARRLMVVGDGIETKLSP